MKKTMKKPIITIALLFSFLMIFPADLQAQKKPRKPKSSSMKGSPLRNYIRGQSGGCYYINRNGKKTYVARRFCGL